jgi:hypothetical protein
MRRVLSLTVALSLGACATDDLGTVDLSLTGQSASGNVFRLREAELLLNGPGTSQVFLTETDPARPSITARLAAGEYTLGLALGWHLERVTADGVGRRVTAQLLSANPQPLTIVPDEVTRVVLLFDADGEAVPVGDGDLDISIGVNDVDAGVAPDASPTDASPPDASPPDASPPDAAPSPPDAGAQAPQATGDDMQPGEILAPGTEITSANGMYSLRFQASAGRLVVIRNSLFPTAVWTSNNSAVASNCILQLDGNLVLYTAAGVPVWSTNTFNGLSTYVKIRNDGTAAVIRTAGNVVVWSTPQPPLP